MQATPPPLLPSAALLLALLAACGPPPRPVDDAESRGGGTSAGAATQRRVSPSEPGPVDPNAQLPADHPPMGSDSAAAGSDHRWDGSVRLRGSLADSEEGFLFVSIKGEGVRMPSYSAKLDISQGRSEGDDLIVPFELTEANVMGGLMEGMDALVLEAYFDPDGIVETKEGQVREQVPVELDQTDVEIVLEG